MAGILNAAARNCGTQLSTATVPTPDVLLLLLATTVAVAVGQGRALVEHMVFMCWSRLRADVLALIACRTTVHVLARSELSLFV